MAIKPVHYIPATVKEKSMASKAETLTLGPGRHDKIGIIHCGVTRDGFIVVGGQPKNIKDNEEIMFERDHIKAERHGSEYVFTRQH